MTRFKYFKNNWKLIVHLLFSTYHFGVNNERWSPFPSLFGKSWYKRIWPPQIIGNYRGMKFRVVGCKFVSEELARMIFPNYFKRR